MHVSANYCVNIRITCLPSQLGSTERCHPGISLDVWTGEAGRRSRTHRKHSGGSPDIPSSRTRSEERK